MLPLTVRSAITEAARSSLHTVRQHPGRHEGFSRIGPAALVLATGWRLQYRTLRCAAQCFDRVYVLGTSAARPLGWSRLTSRFLVVPDDGAFGPTTNAIINAVTAELDIDHVLPSDASTTRFLSEYGSTLTPIVFPVPRPETFDILNNKHHFINACVALGVPTPQSFLLSDRSELLDWLIAGRIPLPLVAKPLEMWGGHGVTIIRQISDVAATKAIRYRPIQVQEYLSGTDLCAFFICRRGMVMADVMYRRTAGRVNFVRNPDVLAECEKLIRHFDVDGIIGFDIRETHNGSFFLECNPRCWYNMDLVMLAGANFVELGLRSGLSHHAARSLADLSIVQPSRLLGPALLLVGRSQLDRALLRYYLADLPMMLRTTFSAVIRRLLAPDGVIWPACLSQIRNERAPSFPGIHDTTWSIPAGHVARRSPAVSRCARNEVGSQGPGTTAPEEGRGAVRQRSQRPSGFST